MKIVTKLSLAQIKTHTGTFITYLRRKCVHINYSQLGIFYTVTLCWVAGAHPSYIYRDEMKDRMAKLMAGEHTSVMHYFLEHFITLTTKTNAYQLGSGHTNHET
jgi:hypothetical protein